MKREYVVRGKRVEIEELEGIVAVLPRVRKEVRQGILYLSFGEERRYRQRSAMRKNGTPSKELAGCSCTLRTR